MVAHMLSVEDGGTEGVDWYILKGLRVQAGDQVVWVWILVHPLASPVTLGTSLDLFVSLFLHLFSGGNNIDHLKELLKRLSKLIYGWLATWGASRTREAGRDERKRHIAPAWQGAGLTDRGTYIRGLSPAATS